MDFKAECRMSGCIKSWAQQSVAGRIGKNIPFCEAPEGSSEKTQTREE
jgi:hypothetical protein